MLKKAILVGVAAMLAMAFSASSASAWTPAGGYTFGDGSTETLTSTLALPGSPTLTCNVVLDTTLDSGTANTGTVDSGSVTNCVTSVPNCSVSVVTNNHPWSLDGTNTGGGSGPVSVYDISFTASYSGASCGLNGTVFTVEGDVAGNYSSGTGGATFPTGGDTLEVTASNTPNVPVGTDVDLTGVVSVQGATVPQLQ